MPEAEHQQSETERPEPTPTSAAGLPARIKAALARRRRTLLTLGACLVVTGGLVVWVVSSLTAAAPSWWRRMTPADPATARLAAQVENAAVTEINRLRSPDDPWAIAVTDEQLSAWLTGALPGWLAAEFGMDEWPPHLSEVQVRFHDGRVTLGARVSEPSAVTKPKPAGTASALAPDAAPPTGQTDQAAAEPSRGSFVSLSVTPRVEPDGSLWLTPRWAYLGRLPVPASMVTAGAQSRARDLLPIEASGSEAIAIIAAAIAGERAAATEPVLTLADGARRVRLLGIELTDGRMTVTCATEFGPVAGQ